MNGRAAFALLLATLAAFFGPPLLRGEVIFPHDESLELGAPPIDGRAPDELPWTSVFALQRDPISNRKFFDESSIYVPEIHQHLHGDHAGWISTWNPHVELGRPTLQMYGFGPAFPLTRVLACFTDDAFTLYTWIVASTLCLAAVFAFLFLGALELHPVACFAGAIGLGLGYVLLYWQTALMLPSSVCWTLAQLWLAARIFQRPTFARALGFAFASYALVMSGYPQQIVWHVYLFAAFAIERGWSARRAGRSPWRPIAVLAAAGLAGLAAAMPTFLDVMEQARASARLDVKPEFFLTLPEIHGPLDLGLLLAKLHDAFWIGNPIFRGYPGKFNWLSFTPVYSTLFLLSWIDGGWRRAWPWQAFTLVCLAITLWPGALLFGVRYLGLSLSPFVPMAAAVIPFGVAGAMTVDHILRRGYTRPWIAACVAALPPLVSAVCVALTDPPLHPGYIGASFALTLVVIAFAWRRHWVWVSIAVLASTALYGARLVLWRPVDSIHASSTLVDAIRRNTPGGSRYAFIGGKDIELLPPNHEARLGLASVHSYNPLTSLHYQSFVTRLSERGPRTYGRQFRRIASDAKVGSDDFSYCDVAAYVSAEELLSPRLALREEIDGVRVYASVDEPPIAAAQIDVIGGVDGVGDTLDPSTGIELAGPLSRQARLPLERIEAHDDAATYRLTRTDHPTLLFLSQQFHPRWRARSSAGELATLRVNDFFQGVLVPPGTDRVDLRFEPFVRWSAYPQWIFAIAGAFAFFRCMRERGRSLREPARVRTVR